MKKIVSLALVLVMVLTLAPLAMALNFTGEFGNESTFETLEEANANSAAVVATIVENRGTWAPHPVLADYPAGTTYVYRSSNMYAGRAAARMNTVIFVYTGEKFADKAAALAYLTNLGLVDIIEECKGSLVLVTPIGDTFGIADATAYYKLQTATLSQKEAGTVDGARVSFASAEYFGGYGNIYFIGIDEGATFFNNFIAIEMDYVSRLAGVLTIGGTMQRVRTPATFVPMYMVNAAEDVVLKYCVANGIDATITEADTVTYINQTWPLRKVVTAYADDVDAAAFVKAAYYGLFIKAQRVPVVYQALYSAATEFSGYGFDQAPYSLGDRCAVLNGKTDGGIYYIAHQHDDLRFQDICTANGEFIDVWYEYLPEEVLNGTAPDGSIPLLLCNHGGGDDARVFVEEQGLLELATKHRVALVAPDHGSVYAIDGEALTAMVDYMLEKYPALDASRVYATGYSMGGGATYIVSYYKPQQFAAVAPFAGSATPITEEQMAQFEDLDLPCIMTITAFDPAGRRLAALEGNPNEAEQGMIKTWNEINDIEVAEFDFDAYPYFGLKADKAIDQLINDEHVAHVFINNNDEGIPMYSFVYIEDMVHCLWPEYGDIMWEFFCHYSRDLETGEIIYTPYAR